MLTDAQKRAIKKYKKEKYAQINLTMLPIKKEKIKQHAKNRNETVNGFIMRAVENQMETDNRTTATENAEKYPS